MQYQIPKPSNLVPGAPGLLGTFVFPQTVMPPPQEMRQMPPSRGFWGEPNQSAPSDPTYTFLQPIQPRRRASFMVVPKTTRIAGTTPSVSSSWPLSALTIQPDSQQMAAWIDSSRYRQAVTNMIHPVTAPITNTLLTEKAGSPQPSSAYWNYLPQAGTKLPFTGPPPAPLQTDIFKVTVMPPNAYGIRPPPILVRRAVPAIPRIVTLEPSQIGQPVRDWWRPATTSTPSRLIITGAAPQQTYLYPTLQPSQQWYLPYRAQQYTAPPIRTEGVTAQGTFIFRVDQPTSARFSYTHFYAQTANTAKPLTGAFTPPPVAQTYVFPLGQPDRASWYAPRVPAQQVKVNPPIPGPNTETPILTASNLQPARAWWAPPTTTETSYEWGFDQRGTLVRRPRNWHTGGRSPKG